MNPLRPRLWPDLEAADLPAALANPPDRYRPVPWLAWTGELPWHRLKQQLTDMRAKGITEFFLFPIYGMELPYMSAAYWQRVGQTLAFCREIGMKCWIYDEYNWPSGVCAGAVLRDHPECNGTHLWIRTDAADPQPLPGNTIQTGAANGVSWALVPDADVHSSVRGSGWCSHIPGYLDMLSLEANQRFLDSTHRRYHERFAEFFPDTIPGFFTDEPGLKSRLLPGWCRLPWTDDLLEAFEARYGYSLMDRLGDLAADTPFSARTRCDYWRLAAERFGEAYGGQQRAWCEEHGIALTGHCLAEESLAGHVRNSGDLWEILRHFTIPGIDMLANADGFNYPYRVAFYSQETDRRSFHLTCKIVHAIVRHSGGREMLSEAYGVCDWGLTLARQKCGFNYQVALGVTLINDNSLITSIADFRKWAIAGKHFTQPWWQHYQQYADYNARLAALHAEGEPVADVAVLYPRSAIWARHNLAAPERLAALEAQMYDLLDELIRQQWHFDFVFEPVLEEATLDGAELVTPHARYRALIVPGADVLPAACLDVLARFARAGGALLFHGDTPTTEAHSLSDLRASMEDVLTGPGVSAINGNGAAVCEALAQHLERPVVLDGDSAREFISSRRRFAGGDAVFIANMAETPADIDICLNLPYPVTVHDPDTQESYRPEVGGNGTFAWHFEARQAFLLLPAEAAPAPDIPAKPAWLAPVDRQALADGWEFSVQPGNMLRLTTQVRPDPENQGTAQGWQRDCGNDGWLSAEDGHWLADPMLPGESPWYWMRAKVRCDAAAAPQILACDNPDFLEVFVNGIAAVQTEHDPLWTEENVFFDVGGIVVGGENTVHIRARTSKYNDPRIGVAPQFARLLQPVVLLGQFLADADGGLTSWSAAIQVDAPWEEQGLPHFAGVGAYRRRIDWDGEGRVFLLCPDCDDAVEARVNNVPCGTRVWPPYVFDLTPGLRQGDNELELLVYNTLGNIILHTYGGTKADQTPRSGLSAPPILLTTMT